MQWVVYLTLLFFVFSTHAEERNKRALYGAEDAYFQHYYQEKGLLNEYNAAKHRGTISNWSTLGSSSYSGAIRASTSYYKQRATAGYSVSDQCHRVELIIAGRIAAANAHGGPDAGHRGAIQLWESGLDQIKIGIHTHDHTHIGC